MAKHMVEQYRSKFWVTHQPVLTDIKWVEIFDDKANEPIFVLDTDPKLCAKYLTSYHITQYIEYIVYSIIMHRATAVDIRRSKAAEKSRVDYMFYNQRTAYWFYTLYQEMQEIYKKTHGRYYKVSEYFKEEWILDMTDIKGPSGIKHKAHKGSILLKDTCIRKKYKDYYDNYANVLTHANSITNRFRMMYMLMGYALSEFPLGAPAWYSNMKATIWTSFNKMTRLYYRIDTNIEGVYSYYYSVDNKNWNEIQNVPLELRYIIDGIIFAREC